MQRLLLSITVLLFSSLILFSQSEIDGTWDGAIDIMGTELIIIVKFYTDEDQLKATIDIPQQGAQGLSLTNVHFEHDSVYFELPAGPGLAVFDGILEGEHISGKFTQAGIDATFYLQKADIDYDIVDEEPLPFREENVYIHNDDIKLGCTLTLPFGDDTFPAVILITGSGGQDRDETIFGFKPFRLLANHLTPHGIAVLRCYDRGIGESTGNLMESTSEDLAGDVNEMVAYLQCREEIVDRKIGLLGHSEGGIIAAMVAAQNNDIAFIISMAGSAVPGRDILIAQSELIFAEMGIDDAILEQQIRIINLVYEAAETGEGWDEIEQIIRQLTPAQFETMAHENQDTFEDVDQFVEQYVRGSLAALQSKWYLFFIRHDPSENWRQITQPVLGVFGELDLQVPPGMNKDAMQEALEYAGNTDYTLKIIPQANHLFQRAETGSPTEYAQLETEFIDGFLDILLTWLRETIEARGN